MNTTFAYIIFVTSLNLGVVFGLVLRNAVNEPITCEAVTVNNGSTFCITKTGAKEMK